MTHISLYSSISVTGTNYCSNVNRANVYNRVILFASRIDRVWLIYPSSDGKIETIILQEVVYLQGSLTSISQSLLLHTEVKVIPVYSFCRNLYNCHGKLTITAGIVNEQLVMYGVVDWALEITEFAYINNDSYALLLKLTAQKYLHDEQKPMVWHHWLVHIRMNALKIKITLSDNTIWIDNCYHKISINDIVTSNPCTSNPSCCARDSLQRVYRDGCYELQTAITTVFHRLCIIHYTRRDLNHYMLKYILNTAEKFLKWIPVRQMELCS